MNKKPHDMIIKTLREKSAMKQDVYHQTKVIFDDLKEVLKSVAEELKNNASELDKRIIIEYKDKGEFEAHLRVAGDTLIFYMHTNVFEFDKSHAIWKTSYVKEHEFNSYCGMINVYNFLSDSFKYSRGGDVGYLIARLFINREKHYFVEGKRQLGFLYNDFVNSLINKEVLKNIVESAILYSLDFDLFTPPFDNVKEISVQEIMEANNRMQIQTGKRLGFRFNADNDQID